MTIFLELELFFYTYTCETSSVSEWETTGRSQDFLRDVNLNMKKPVTPGAVVLKSRLSQSLPVEESQDHGNSSFRLEDAGSGGEESTVDVQPQNIEVKNRYFEENNLESATTPGIIVKSNSRMVKFVVLIVLIVLLLAVGAIVCFIVYKSRSDSEPDGVTNSMNVVTNEIPPTETPLTDDEEIAPGSGLDDATATPDI